MSLTNTYEIAGTDELEALGRDDMEFDTSAGIQADEQVDPGAYAARPKTAFRPRLCAAIAVVVLILVTTATLLGIFLPRRGGSDSPSSANKPPQENATPGPTKPAQSTRPNEPVAPTTVEPATSASTTDATTATESTQTTASTQATQSTEVKKFPVKVIARTAHDPMAFTQGFEYANGIFYESTGLHGQSSLRKVEVKTGKVIQKYNFPDMSLFGEGLTLHTTHHIFMLTWQAGRGFVFNQSTFEVVKEWRYKGQGWGLCMDREKDEVYMSDGTTHLRVLDPEDLSEKRRIKVTLRGKSVRDLNEIEWICGEVWSNVWQTSKIYRIDPTTGRVKAIIDASSLPLKGDMRPANDVLNGIAFDRETGRLWLTGKRWPAVYQVSIVDDSLDLTKCK